MFVGRAALTLLLSVVAGAADAGFIQPTYDGDFAAFVRFLQADGKCSGFRINYEKTLEQVTDLGAAIGWDTEITNQHILKGATAARQEAEQNLPSFCSSVRQLYDSYDPAHLRKVGVID